MFTVFPLSQLHFLPVEVEVEVDHASRRGIGPVHGVLTVCSDVHKVSIDLLILELIRKWTHLVSEVY